MAERHPPAQADGLPGESHPSRVEAPLGGGDADHQNVDDVEGDGLSFDTDERAPGLGTQGEGTETGLDDGGPMEGGTWVPLIAGASIALFIGVLILVSSLGGLGA